MRPYGNGQAVGGVSPPLIRQAFSHGGLPAVRHTCSVRSWVCVAHNEIGLLVKKNEIVTSTDACEKHVVRSSHAHSLHESLSLGQFFPSDLGWFVFYLTHIVYNRDKGSSPCLKILVTLCQPCVHRRFTSWPAVCIMFTNGTATADETCFVKHACASTGAHVRNDWHPLGVYY